MKLTLLGKRPNEILLFLSNTESYVYNTKKGLIYKTTDFLTKDWEWEEGLLNGKIILNPPSSLVIVSENNIVFVDSKSGEIIDVEDYTLLEAKKEASGFLSSKFLCADNVQLIDDVYCADIGYLNLAEDEFQLIKPNVLFSKIYSVSKGFILLTKEAIVLYDTSLNCQLWSFNAAKMLPESKNNKGEMITHSIERYYGVCNNLVWLHITEKQLVALSLETGTIVHHSKHPFKDIEIHESIFFDKELGVLKKFSKNVYKEFNLTTLTLHKDGVIKCDKSLTIEKANFYVNTKYSYFIGCYNGVNYTNAVGVFNSDTCTVICVVCLENSSEEHFFKEVPIVCDNFLGVMDNKDVLHIYAVG